MTAPPVTETQDVCASDPNFAVIFAFCEQFGDNCGVTIPTFQELQDMLEKTNEVPDALVDLHIKLLRRVKKSVHIDKWEKAIIKFCQVYSIPEFWELERYGYKGISIQLKLKILKTLFEAQFDSNVKFKAEINKLESSVLRSQPLGWDKSGIAYWVQFDRACNLRIYKEDIEEDTWTIVAKNRSTLVKLINDLSGQGTTHIDNMSSTGTNSDTEVELSPGLDQEKHSPLSSTHMIENDKKEHNINDSNVKLENNVFDQKNNSIEKPINLKRKLIEEYDDSHNNAPIVGEEIEESVMIVKGEGSGNECDTGNPDEINTQNETSKNEDVKKPKLWSIDNICSSSKEVSEEIISVPKTGFFFGDDSVPCFNNVSNGESSLDEIKLEVESSEIENKESENNENIDEIDSTSILHNMKDYSTKTEDELSSKKTLKQSVFNIKVHEEEVQITERNANDVFTTSEFSKKNNVLNESMTVESIKDKQLITSDISDKCNIDQNKTDKYKLDSDNEELEYKIEDDVSNKQPSDQTNSNINNNKQITEQDNISIKSKEIIGDKTEQQLTTIIDDQIIKTNEHVFDNNINEPSTSVVIKPIKKIEKVDNHREKINKNELLANTVDIHEQKSIDIIEQNSCVLDKKTLLNIVDSGIINDNHTLTEDCNIIGSKEAIINLVTEDNQNNDVIDHIQTTDYSKSNSMYLNYNLNQQTIKEIDNSNSLSCTIDGISNTEMLDKTVVSNLNQCLKASNLDDQNYKKSKKTSHNISNIIETDVNVVSDSTKLNRQSTITNINENMKLDNCKINFVNAFQKEKSVENVDCSIISNNKHNVDYILQKPDDIKKIPSLNHQKESTKELKSIDKPESSNVEMIIKMDKVDTEKLDDTKEIPSLNHEKESTKEYKLIDIPEPSNAEINKMDTEKSDDIKKIPSLIHEKESTKEFKLIDKHELSNVEIVIKMEKKNKEKSEVNIKTKNIDISNELTVDKEYSAPTKDEKNSILVIPNVHEKQKEVIETVISKMHMNDKLPTISTKNCIEDLKQEHLEITYTEINLNKSKNENESVNDDNKSDYLNKKELVNTENISDYLNEKELNSKKLKNDLCNNTKMHNLSDHKRSLSMETSIIMDEDNNDEIVQFDQSTVDKPIKSNENKITIDKVIKDQNLKTKEEKMELEEEDKLKTINSSVHEDMYESTDENNEEPFIGNPINEYDNSEMVDYTTKVDIKQSEEEEEEEEEIEETPKKRGRPGRKKGKRGRAKKNTIVKQNVIEEKLKRPYKPRQKKVTIAEEVTIFPEPAGDDNKRRSRRIAEIKIKEQFIPTTLYDDIDIPLKDTKKNDKTGKKGSTFSRKMKNVEESDDEDEEDSISKKFKKRKRKGKADSLKKLNIKNPWNVDSGSSSSENNIELFEDYDHEEEDEIPRPGIELNISDHEFSPESDINDDEYLPEKRARTAHKKDQGEQLKDDMCQKCNKSDQPEWILLCDTCNQGWHASCLHPPLMVIPDGDWYCPPCRHEALLNALKDTLKKYDGESKKRENEELRRKRLAYVGISLQNVISSKQEEIKTDKNPIVNESSEDNDEESEAESYDSEPLYQLRARRQANVSYRFNDYDDMINEAILEETGIDESVVSKSVEVKTDKNDNDEKTDSDNNISNRNDSPIAPALLHLRGRKKSKKLTNLDISSDDGSDEDFKGPSDGDDDYEEEEMSEFSDDSVKRRPQPTRRSVRNRKTVVDPDFINDDSSEESDSRSKKKRSRPWSDSSNSEEDLTWGKKKKKRTNAFQSSSSSYKQSKATKRRHSDNNTNRKPKNSKIKYGMDSDSDMDEQSKRRTRARQITYAESDDSEEEIQNKKRKVVNDEEDEYVLNDEEIEVENEDRNLEVDDEDTASNEEKDEDDNFEEDVVADGDDDDDNDDNYDDDDDDEKEDNSKKVAISTITSSIITVKSPSANIQSVIQESTSTSHPLYKEHQRLLPSKDNSSSVANLQTSLPSSVIESPTDKCKRSSHQVKKSQSPNHPADYGGGIYPCPPDATKVTSNVSQPPVHITYNRLTQQGTGGGQPATTTGFKPTATVAPPGGFPIIAPYRTANKITPATTAVLVPPAYLQPPPQQVPQVYQTPPPPPPPTNFSSYPIDYTAVGAQLPPPPPSIPFRNVVVAPPMTHEPLPIPQQISGNAGGDSEFGGLVSYFSSQQEDDFDT